MLRNTNLRIATGVMAAMLMIGGAVSAFAKSEPTQEPAAGGGAIFIPLITRGTQQTTPTPEFPFPTPVIPTIVATPILPTPTPVPLPPPPTPALN